MVPGTELSCGNSAEEEGEEEGEIVLYFILSGFVLLGAHHPAPKHLHTQKLIVSYNVLP